MDILQDTATSIGIHLTLPTMKQIIAINFVYLASSWKFRFSSTFTC